MESKWQPSVRQEKVILVLMPRFLLAWEENNNNKDYNKE